MRPEFLIGLDLGQRHDFTALSVVERRDVAGGAEYDVVHLARWRDVSYTAVPEAVRAVTRRIAEAEALSGAGWALRPPPAVSLVVDQTGVGVAVVDILRAAGLDPISVIIHGGDATVRASDREWRTPKRELAGVVQVLLQGRRLRIVERLPLAATLRAEMENFRAKIDLTTGHDSYAAGADWRQGAHDDLVLSVALAAWYGERPTPLARSYSYLPTDDDEDDVPVPRWFGAG